MKDLLKISTSIIGTENVNSVNARNIYEYLELSKGQFSRWIKSAIDKYDFIENEDYITIDMDVEGVKNYIVTLDMAKELCMVSNTEKGKETRKYFINFEKHAKNVIQNQSQEIQLLQGMLNTISKMDHRVVEVEEDVNYLKNKSPITYNQIKILEDKRKSKTRDLVGYNPNDEISKFNYSKTIRSLTKHFKNKFGVSRYADLPKDKFSDAMVWLNNVSLVDLI